MGLSGKAEAHSWTLKYGLRCDQEGVALRPCEMSGAAGAMARKARSLVCKKHDSMFNRCVGYMKESRSLNLVFVTSPQATPMHTVTRKVCLI